MTEPVAAHTNPARCSIELDQRLLPGDDPAEQVRSLTALLADPPMGTISVQAGAAMFPCEVDPDSPLVRAVMQACSTATGSAPQLQSMSAASDAGFFNRSGIPTVCYGAGSVARAHTDDDVVAIDDVLEIAAVYAELMRIGCGRPPDVD
jgi:acetylornithine deacetylase/succinyl-diaminopimelate desuccinylase-like protein